MKQLFPVHCSALCGNNAVGSLVVTDKISLPMCEECRNKIDVKHRFERFDLTEEEEEEEEA
jgi:hypothetical protein